MIVRSVAPADRLDDDDAALLLYAGRVVKLGPLGAAIVELATDPIDLADLTDELERRFGRPATVRTEEATREAVNDLIEIGVLVSLRDPSEPVEEPT